MEVVSPHPPADPFASTAKAQESFRIGPAPTWVTPKSIPWRATGKPQTHALLLLSDTQRRPAEGLRYERDVRRLLTKEAVQHLSQVELQWDPETEILTLHEVALWREGVSRSFCERSRVLLRQREGSLESQILHGRMSAILLLDDVRPGDCIEVVHSIQTTQQLSGERFDFLFLLDRWNPTANWSISVHLPPDTPCQVQAPHHPQVYPAGDHLVREWSGTQPENQEPEPLTPSWHSALPFGQCSGYATWNEIARLVCRAWDSLATDTPELRSLAQEIAGPHETLETKAQALVRWVQDDVRYLGLEMGLGRTLPSAPTEVAARRYGDCKDKSLLLVALLRCVGIHAAPVLVHSALRQEVASLLPALSAFDHVIAVLWLDGTPLFMDGTLSSQGGSLRNRCLPPFGKGLILAEDTEALTDILTPTLERSSLRYTEDIHPHPKAGVSRVDWHLEAVGSEADWLRARIQQLGPEAFAKNEAQAAQEFLPDAQSLGSCTVADHLDENRILVTGSFAFGSWGAPVQQGIRLFRWQPLWIRAFLSGAPVTVATRRHPLLLRHPGLFHQRVRIHYPAHVETRGFSKRVESAWFRAMTTVSRVSSTVVEFAFSYQSLREAVSPTDYPEYARVFREFVENQLGVQLPLRYSASEPTPLSGAPDPEALRTPARDRDAGQPLELLASANADTWFARFVPKTPWHTRLWISLTSALTGPGSLRRKVVLTLVLLSFIKGFLASPASRTPASAEATPRAEAPLPPLTPLQIAERAFDSGNLPRAEQLTQAMLQSQPDNPQAIRLLLYVLMGTQRRSDAVALTERFLEKHPQDASLWQALCDAYRGLRRFDRAQEALEKALALEPANPVFQASAIFLLIDQNLVLEALRRARALEATHPKHPAALKALGAAAFAALDPSVLDVLRQLHATEPSVQNTLLLARALDRFGDPSELPALLEPLSQTHPRLREVWALLEITYQKLGQPEKQREASAKLLQLP
jgi:tetratricopeptide (TPR) repeat protein